MDHAIHHLTDTEAVAEVVKRVVTVVLLNCQLEPREKKIFAQWLIEKDLSQRCLQLPVYQPALQCNGVHVELLHKSQVMVHILQTTQHLSSQRQSLVWL